MTTTSQKIKVAINNTCPQCGNKWLTYVEIEEDYLSMLGWSNEVENSTLCDTCNSKLIAENKIFQEKTRINQAIETANIPQEFVTWDKQLGNSKLANFVYQNKDKNLFLSGMYGTGKSRSLAINLVKLITKNEQARVKYFRFTELAMQYASICREDIGQASNFIKQLLNYDIVVIDDLAKKRITDNAGEFMYDIFDNLYCGKAKCKLWVSSNINWRKLANLFENKDCGNAVVSRIDRLISENRLTESEVQ
jgi:DNA replication protein DnaC